MLELSPLNIRPYLHLYVMILEAVVEISGALIVWWFQNGFFMILVITALNTGLIVAVVFAPESPKFLYASKRWDELHKTLNYIAKFNGAKEWDGKFDEEVHSDHHNDEQLGFFEMIKMPSVKYNLLIMSLNWAC